MKMLQLFSKRSFAVVTSLALCTSLVAPALAANFNDLQKAVRGQEGYDTEAISVSDSESGRVVTLLQDIERTGSEQAVNFNQDVNVTIDLNGQTIDGSTGGSGSVFTVSKGTLTIQDSTAEYDEDGNQTYAGDGQITGGSGGNGGGVYISDNGQVTLESGNITGNTASFSGGGVGVNGSNASFTMEGGVISGNTAANGRGEGGGGGVWIKSGAGFTMNGGEITDNTVNGDKGNGGGVAIHQANFEMNGGEISKNESARGTGVLINASNDALYGAGGASFTMNGGTVTGQNGTSCIYLEEKNDQDAVFSLSGDAVMNGSIFLGSGTQVITDEVVQPGDVHVYTGFDVVGNDSEITPDQTESSKTDGTGYMAKEDTLLDIKYDHVWKDSWDVDDDSHSHSCEYCDEQEPGSDDEHVWDGGKVTQEPTATEDGVMTYTCQVCGAEKTEPIPATGEGDSEEPGEEIEIPDVAPPLAGLPDPGDEIELEDEAIPLAGLITRGDVIGYLWEKSGSPEWELSDFEDVPGDHQWATAIGWAQTNGIAVADLDGNFRPDDLILRSVEDIELSPEGELEQFLNRYAVYAGIVLEPDELFIELAGDWDDIIMGEDAQVIFDDFFAKLELALAQAA